MSFQASRYLSWYLSMVPGKMNCTRDKTFLWKCFLGKERISRSKHSQELDIPPIRNGGHHLGIQCKLVFNLVNPSKLIPTELEEGYSKIEGKRELKYLYEQKMLPENWTYNKRSGCLCFFWSLSMHTLVGKKPSWLSPLPWGY